MLNLITNSEQLQGKVLLNQNNEVDYSMRSWQGCPSFAIDKNNVFYAAWYSGGKGEGPGNYVTLSVSTDEGKTWMSNKLIVAPTLSSPIRFFDPALWRGPDDNLYLFWTKSKNNWDGVGGVWGSVINYQADTIAYSSPKRLADGDMLNKPVYSNNFFSTVYLPIAVWIYKPTPPANTGIFVYSVKFDTTANGYGQINKYANIPMPASLRSYDEPQIFQTAGKNFSAYIRGIDGIYVSNSTDACNNWSVPEKLTTFGTLTSSRFHVSKLQSGNLLFILNNSSSRTNMVAYLSKDNGATWPYQIQLDNRANTSYPDADQDKDGTIHIVYDRDRYHAKEIDFVSLNEADIIDKNSTNIKRVVISN